MDDMGQLDHSFPAIKVVRGGGSLFSLDIFFFHIYPLTDGRMVFKLDKGHDIDA
jgi:hypothetical protein